MKTFACFPSVSCEFSLGAPVYTHSPQKHAFLGWLQTLNCDLCAPPKVYSLPLSHGCWISLTSYRGHKMRDNRWRGYCLSFNLTMRPNSRPAEPLITGFLKFLLFTNVWWYCLLAWTHTHARYLQHLGPFIWGPQGFLSATMSPAAPSLTLSADEAPW